MVVPGGLPTLELQMGVVRRAAQDSVDSHDHIHSRLSQTRRCGGRWGPSGSCGRVPVGKRALVFARKEGSTGVGERADESRIIGGRIGNRVMEGWVH
jgi:hypothetical protein